MTAKRRITILGSTGSVGVNTLDVVARHPDRFEVAALSARHQADALFEQCRRFQPRFAIMLEAGAAQELEKRVRASGLACQVGCGIEALEEVASLPEVDIVMAAIVGIAGLRPALAAARAGKKLLLANKESLITAGAVFMNAVQANNATLLPIDSEHNAIFQALPRDYARQPGVAGVRRIDDEQGPRSDRSALAVQRGPRLHRGRDTSGKRHPFAGGVCGRIRACSA